MCALAFHAGGYQGATGTPVPKADELAGLLPAQQGDNFDGNTERPPSPGRAARKMTGEDAAGLVRLNIRLACWMAASFPDG